MLPVSPYDVGFRFVLFFILAIAFWFGYKRRNVHKDYSIAVPEELAEQKRIISRKISRRELFDNGNVKNTPIWTSVFGLVFELDTFLDEHPGGSDRLLAYAGADATTAFDEVSHSSAAYERMLCMIVGVMNTDEDKFFSNVVRLRKNQILTDLTICTVNTVNKEEPLY